eukprot:Protomagalhaensia_sp_Gyna_25__902@NODE_1434_length_1839_cov_33_141667_g1158_i0_p1_GENE_NODE_1434_length_1839_cov_33_141667_g1158_i0NODE_1434_length_1839_cov_33_141667_g1158_i0_p1_ORF_typecomplete_len194_score15_29zfRING_2/PF13639_6/9_6e02zfRING_2/PF13639_6/5_6e16zfRING_11/PF17123_5/6_1e03zfRING_11/PF17123_5/1_6e10zfRING_11/PF17123_5/1_5e03zfC3HC4_2/PF13923_6/8_3e02zfC3HC4_2/PF13923_6/7_3e09zfRING_5/PF14634_6/8_7e02zfRING_5/PF14634_6/9_9e09zfC3HC4/PF00097_25/2_9e03zfC3HC4/PF00097_25/2_1e08zfrbx1/
MRLPAAEWVTETDELCEVTPTGADLTPVLASRSEETGTFVVPVSNSRLREALSDWMNDLRRSDELIELGPELWGPFLTYLRLTDADLAIRLACFGLATFARAHSPNQCRICAHTAIFNADEGTINDQCAICLEDFRSRDVLRSLPCSHQFHVMCIDPWLRDPSSRCPICRFDLASRSLPLLDRVPALNSEPFQ